MAERRRYTKRTKAGAVTKALASSAQAASEATGIPRRTIGYWMDSPEFAELRQKTREDMAEEASVLAHKTLEKIKDKLDQFEPKDLAVLFGILTDKGQLLSGGPTSRSEVSVTEGWDDHERMLLKDAIAAELGKRVEA